MNSVSVLTGKRRTLTEDRRECKKRKRCVGVTKNWHTEPTVIRKAEAVHHVEISEITVMVVLVIIMIAETEVIREIETERT